MAWTHRWAISQIINQSLGSRCQLGFVSGFCLLLLGFYWLNDAHNTFSFGPGNGPAAVKP